MPTIRPTAMATGAILVTLSLLLSGCAACLSTAQLRAKEDAVERERTLAIEKEFSRRGWTLVPLSEHQGDAGVVVEPAENGWSWVRGTEGEMTLRKQFSYGARPDMVARTREGKYLTVEVHEQVVRREKLSWCDCDPGMGMEPPARVYAFGLARADYASHQVLQINTRALDIKEGSEDPRRCHSAP